MIFIKNIHITIQQYLEVPGIRGCYRRGVLVRVKSRCTIRPFTRASEYQERGYSSETEVFGAILAHISESKTRKFSSPAAGVFNVLTLFFNVSAHIEVKFYQMAHLKQEFLAVLGFAFFSGQKMQIVK